MEPRERAGALGRAKPVLMTRPLIHLFAPFTECLQCVGPIPVLGM